ncbi:MAG: methyltransferase domain-containing protein [Rickettsiales bacterium]|nr:methyltransferase domain-containing protein [Rickettsiales bacterium]
METNTPHQERKESKGFFKSSAANIGWIMDWFREISYKINNLVETNYELACQMAADGRVDDAIFRFKILLWLEPNYTEAIYNLGCLYLHKGERQQALDHFTKVLRKQPMHQNAIYMVASINPSMLKEELLPQTLPYSMALEYFEGMARQYDAYQHENEYKLPDLVGEMTRKEVGNEMTNDLVDLGCGTGLLGVQFREMFTNTIGVDMANQMLDIAHRRVDDRGVMIYTRLAHQDIRNYLKDAKAGSADVVLCISVFPYLGELDSIFAGVRKLMRPGALFVCSYDPYVGMHGYSVLPETGYFGHRNDYVMETAKRHGLQAVRTGSVMAYPERPVELHIYRLPVENTNYKKADDSQSLTVDTAHAQPKIDDAD